MKPASFDSRCRYFLRRMETLAKEKAEAGDAYEELWRAGYLVALGDVHAAFEAVVVNPHGKKRRREPSYR